MSAQVEVSSVATPLTMLRYTGNWRATLACFSMAGQWVHGAGVPNAAMSGKSVLRALCALCAKEGQRFGAS